MARRSNCRTREKESMRDKSWEGKLSSDFAYPKKKTSGGVAPIHLRKCATAEKPLDSELSVSKLPFDSPNYTGHRFRMSIKQSPIIGILHRS